MARVSLTKKPSSKAVPAPMRRATMPANREASKQTMAAQEVSPHVETTEQNITRYGSVSQVGASPGSFFTLTLQPGTNADEYIIGDADGIVAAAASRPFAEPDSSSSSTVTAIKAATRQGIAITGLHYQVDSSAAQFANAPKLLTAGIDGSFGQVPLNVLAATRPDYENDKLLVIEFAKPVVLDSRNAVSLNVNGGETVTLNFFVGAFGY